jgi:hypothetical protein
MRKNILAPIISRNGKACKKKLLKKHNKPIKSGPRTEEEGIEKAIKEFEREKKN